MFQKDKWPFSPVRLSEIIDDETLAVVESGCCERLGRPMTILDYDPQTSSFCHRIESINEKRRYEEFCRFLRDERHVNGGDTACKQCDIEQARQSLIEFQRTGDPFRVFECHMGLIDMTYVIQVRNCPVAIAFSGQYRSPAGIGNSQEIAQKLEAASRARIELGEMERKQLLELAQKLVPMPADARERLEREAKHVQRIAEAEFGRCKRQWEQDFLDELRRTSEPRGDGRAYFQPTLHNMLERIRVFCRCECVVFFGSAEEGDTLLAPIAKVGIPPAIAQSLPHFNWKKASLPTGNLDTQEGDIVQWLSAAKFRGFRGANSEYFVEASCVIPTSLGDQYRGILVIGPLAEQVNLQEERRFLIALADTVGLFALTSLEVFYLGQERRRWKSTATLLIHQLKTALTPVTVEIGRAKLLIQKGSGGLDVKRVNDFLSKAEDMALQLAQGAKQTLAGHVLQLEPDDLEFEQYPLPVLVGNCAMGFVGEAEKKKLKLVVEDGVESLPDADVDVARLTIALANLIENAVKYSYPDTTIYIRSRLDWIIDADRARVIIEVDNLGCKIRQEDRESIFEQGTRGLTAVKLGRIPGSGLGLWEARAVVQAHGGEITVRCDPTSIYNRMGRPYHVVFSVKIPLRQKDRNKGVCHAREAKTNFAL